MEYLKKKIGKSKIKSSKKNNISSSLHNNNILNIDKRIEYEMKKAQEIESKTIRILLLGTGDSGKTTLVKQMKIYHKKNIKKELELTGLYIKEAIIGYIKHLLNVNIHLVQQNYNKYNYLKINNNLINNIKYILNLKDPYILNENIANIISILWQDIGLKRTLELRHLFQIHDNVEYFFDKVKEIGNINYIPTLNDYLRIRTKTSGFTSETFSANIPKFGMHNFEFIDVGGQRSERKKWMKVLSSKMDAVLFVVAISEYDMKCYEDNKTLRLHEAIMLFEKILKLHFFDGKSLILFFNKYDLFKKKIKKVPITVGFPDFPSKLNPNNEEQVVKFIASKFLKSFTGVKCQLASPLHIHRTTALDTNLITSLLKTITNDLVKLNLKRCGMI